VISPPAVANGVVYVGLVAPHLVNAYDATTGALLWSGAVGGFVYSGPAVVNGVVYAGAQDGVMYAFDLGGVVPAG
jgi:outer membrane protein assembly factor BamB